MGALFHPLIFAVALGAGVTAWLGLAALVQRVNKRVGTWLAMLPLFCILAFAVALPVFGGWLVYASLTTNPNRVPAGWVVTTGTMISCGHETYRGRGIGMTCTPTVRYIDKSTGASVTFEARWTNWNPHPGQRATIAYNPTDPQQAKWLHEPGSPHANYEIQGFTILGTYAFFIGLIAWAEITTKRKKRRRQANSSVPVTEGAKA